jgi:hypothetical protein
MLFVKSQDSRRGLKAERVEMPARARSVLHEGNHQDTEILVHCKSFTQPIHDPTTEKRALAFKNESYGSTRNTIVIGHEIFQMCDLA